MALGLRAIQWSDSPAKSGLHLLEYMLLAPDSSCYCLIIQSSANDALPTDELNRLLAHFGEHPRPSTGSESDPKFFAGLLSRGDILVDDRPHLSLGRKLFDLRQLGVPWILIAKVSCCPVFSAAYLLT